MCVGGGVLAALCLCEWRHRNRNQPHCVTACWLCASLHDKLRPQKSVWAKPVCVSDVFTTKYFMLLIKSTAYTHPKGRFFKHKLMCYCQITTTTQSTRHHHRDCKYMYCSTVVLIHNMCGWCLCVMVEVEVSLSESQPMEECLCVSFTSVNVWVFNRKWTETETRTQCSVCATAYTSVLLVNSYWSLLLILVILLQYYSAHCLHFLLQYFLKCAGSPDCLNCFHIKLHAGHMNLSDTVEGHKTQYDWCYRN